MLIRQLRLQKALSQEQLAEAAKLSLRTIQRVEAGHRVSYGSLRALVAIFELDIDDLERKLYAMNTPANEFVEKPLWARMLLNMRTLERLSRSGLVRHEVSLIIYALFAYAASFAVPKVEIGLLNSS